MKDLVHKIKDWLRKTFNLARPMRDQFSEEEASQVFGRNWRSVNDARKG